MRLVLRIKSTSNKNCRSAAVRTDQRKECSLGSQPEVSNRLAVPIPDPLAVPLAVCCGLARSATASKRASAQSLENTLNEQY